MTNRDIIDIVKNNVNYLGYGISDGWIGYCERVELFKEEIGNEIIGIFLSFFSNRNIHIITSAIKVKDGIIDDDALLRKKLIDIENRLVHQKYIDISEEEDEYLDGYSKAIRNPKFKVIENCNDQIISDFSTLFFVDSSIEGHCFFLIKDFGILAYPHEDTGFGFIKYNDTCKKLNVEGFFIEVQRHPNFRCFFKM